jgi:hypothetical protein
MDGVAGGDTPSVRLMRMDEAKLMPWRKPFRWVADPPPTR